ncbi:hypothetical protein MNBD_PLANCTO02-1246, partial [hydrothermal vent metagenome]
HTKKNRFRIPYRYDQAEMRRLGASEIRLYVSTDKGTNWRKAQSVAPATGRFIFDAGSEQEYWFAVRTLDSRNQLHPGGNRIEAGLKVVVDQTPPTLKIQCAQLQGNRVQLSWSASDANLDVSRLKIEYRQTGQEEWQTVSIVPQASGQTSWTVPAGATVHVRGVAMDKALNIGRGKNQIQITGRQPVIEPDVSNYNEPIANHHHRGTKKDHLEEGFKPNGTTLEPSPFSSASNKNNPLYSNRKMGSQRSRTEGSFVSQNHNNSPDITQRRYGAQKKKNQWSDLPANARIVKSRNFTIGYRVDDVGPSGIGKVEFYITQNGGKKWWRYGEDKDRQSPFQAEVPQDGIYGFTMRVQSGVGLVAPPPQPGEKPDIIIAVDQTAPQVQLLQPQQGTGSSLNKILLRWKVEEAHPMSRSVAISYAATLDGPWEEIVGWSEDTNNYLWSVKAGMPPKVYVRISARDAAGNVTHAETPNPIVVDLSKPRARIVDVEPINSY